MDQRVMADCVANARALAPALAAAGARIEAGRELPPDIVDALHEARLFRMLVPRSYGGDEVSPIAFMAAIEELAKADASTAWCVAQTSVCSTISSSLKPAVAAEIFKNDPRGVLAWGPSTSKNAKAVAEPGGFRVSGEWPFASGSRHATWLAAHSFIYETDGSLRHDAAGEPVQKTFVVPRHSAVIKDVWHVIGLKGTGSDTYALTDVFVPEDHAVAHHVDAVGEVVFLQHMQGELFVAGVIFHQQQFYGFLGHFFILYFARCERAAHRCRGEVDGSRTDAGRRLSSRRARCRGRRPSRHRTW